MKVQRMHSIQKDSKISDEGIDAIMAEHPDLYDALANDDIKRIKKD